MPWGSVTVNGPSRRDVYLNGNYEEAAGRTGATFVVEYGANTFETLDDARRIDFRARATLNEETPHADVVLAPVSPPEPTRETLGGEGEAEDGGNGGAP